MFPRASTVAFTVILLLPLILLIPLQPNRSVLGKADYGVQPVQEYSSEETTQPTCDPTQYFLISTTPQIQIVSFDLNKQLFRPGETVSFAGSVNVDEIDLYANCYGQSYTSQNPVSPTQAIVQVTILDTTLHFTPSSSGSFAGNTILPFTISGGDYTATAVASFQGASDTRKASFTVETYSPTLSIKYPSVELQAHPGESVVLEGDGWIPNMPVLVEVDDNFSVSTDASGHFSLQIPIALENPLAEGTHTVTAEQANLVESTIFVVKYLTLVLSVSSLSPIMQGQNLTLSGNVTTLETREAVPNANVTIMLIGRTYTLQTSANGTFETQVSIGASTSPGAYAVYANATRRGFTAATPVTETMKVLPAANVPLVAAVIVAGSAAGAATSLTLRKVPKLKGTPAGHADSSTIGPGTDTPQSHIGPGTQQIQPKIGAGQQPILSPGEAVKGGTNLGEIRTGPVPLLGTSEFCIHCGMEIRRGSSYCPECGLGLK
ncbi:MAG TPA: zinc ribbon domain-containing protein [Candidatus Dormibacteraeota bacterium]|nr:zinc ribbon domain-containing protein [Candidatus Dormibacteraeota bacterium]